VVLPEQQVVIAITSGLGDMQKVLNVAYDKLLPAIGNGVTIPANPEAHDKLTAKLKSLTIKPVAGSATASDLVGKKFVFADNDEKWQSLKLERGELDGEIALVVEAKGTQGKMVCPVGQWKRADSGWIPRGASPGEASGPVAGSGAWTADKVFTAKACYYETPFITTYKLTFGDSTVTVDISQNLAFGPSKTVTLTGKLE
jgi:hypothetical protein